MGKMLRKRQGSSSVFKWNGHFRDGRDVEDNPRNGRPTECRSNEKFERIFQLLSKTPTLH